jgi:hypothetical protein
LENWEKVILEEIDRELLQDDPVVEFFEAVQFQSFSKGRKRKRKVPKRIILIRPSGAKRWFSWDGEDDCSLPWDEWATEAIGFSQTDCLGDDLRSQVLDLLERFGKI